MSDLSVKSTRRKFQGFFKMCLKSHFAPTAFVGASTFVKPTRRYLFILFLIPLNNLRALLTQSQTQRDRNTLRFRRV